MAENTPPSALAQTLNQLSGQQKMGLILALAALIAVSFGLWLWGTTPDYRVLYSNLSDRDGGAIIDSLQQMNVPYKFAEGGGALLVPASQVHEVRLRLASQGLPKGGTVGFELMENQKFGTSEFLEQVNYKRALEGELARSVQTLASVQTARIHLAIPKPTVFVKDQESPSASVVLALYPGRTLDAGQVNAVVHLISSSVPNMPAKNVTVVDQSGTLLSAPPDKANTGLDESQLKYVHQVEGDYVKRIEDIVTPLVGPRNVHAQVTADVDFTQSEQTAETYKPNQPPNQAAVLSQQTLESDSTNGSNTAGGIPGALSNQPPVPATAPLNAPPAKPAVAAAAKPGAPAAATGATAAAQSSPPASTSNRKETTTNFQVDRTISHTKMAVGMLRRMSVAVVLNNRTVTDTAGKVSTRPLSDAEKNQIAALIKDAVGFDEKRGDTLSLLNSAFNEHKEVIPETPLWKQPETLSMVKEGLKYAVIGAVALFLVLGIIRPAFRNLSRVLARLPEPRMQRNDIPPMTDQGSQAGYAPSYENNLGTAKQLAQQDPKIVASVVKEWVGANE
ncbi:MAG: flagellar M-ring protein FliF [Betaproteobacteria bacterium]|nr:flagellar M-ring protein FliF [Betaproteobacteria bacterium]